MVVPTDHSATSPHEGSHEAPMPTAPTVAGRTPVCYEVEARYII